MNKRIRILLLTVILVTAFFISLFFILSSQPNILKNRVASPDDDGRSFLAPGSEIGFRNENGDWASLQVSASYSFGTRFTNVSLPRNAEILSAYVELYSISTPGHQHINCNIYCDDQDYVVNFTSMGVLELCGRIYSENFTHWNETVPYGKWVKTPSISRQIQEVINRPDWERGNSVAVLFITRGIPGYSAAFANYEFGKPARLYIAWQ